MKKELFCGFEQKVYNNNIYLEALKAKALFDYIYLRKNNFINFSMQELLDMRLKTDEITKKDLKELEKYVKLSQNYKMKIFYANLGFVMGLIGCLKIWL